MRFPRVFAPFLAVGLATGLFAAQPAAVETKVHPLIVVKGARLVEPVTGRVLADVTVLEQVGFVLKGGAVVKNSLTNEPADRME